MRINYQLGIFICLPIILLALKPGSKMAVANSSLVQLRDKIIPVLDKKLNYLFLPNYSRKLSEFEFNFSDSVIHFDPIDINQVLIEYKNLSTKTDISISQINSNATIYINYSFGKVIQKITCYASMKEINLIAIITNDINNSGGPKVKVSAKIQIEISKANFKFVGSVTAKILEVLEPVLKAFIVESTDIVINRELDKWISETINKELSNFQIDLQIYNDIYVNYELCEVPYYVDNFTTISLSGYAYKRNKKVPPTLIPEELPNSIKWNNTTIQYMLGSYIFNSLLKLSYEDNVFRIKYPYYSSPFQLDMDCFLTSPPNLIIDKIVMSNFSFKCFVNATNESDSSNTGISNQSLVQFPIKTLLSFVVIEHNYTNLKFEKPQEFNTTWFEQDAYFIGIPAFNKINWEYLLDYGFPFPILNDSNYTKPFSESYPNYIGIFTNITI